MNDPIRRSMLAITLALAALPALACGSVDLPITLALEDPSDITIDIPIFPPPNDSVTTFLVGGVDTTISADLGFFELIGIFLGQALAADVSVDDVAIAGTPVLLAGILDSGTLCVSQDSAMPGGGQALLNVLLGMAAFDVALNTLIDVANPSVAALLGGSLPFSAEIDAMTPLGIGDLLGLLGGGTGGLSLSQTINTTLPPDTPVIGAAAVTAMLTLTAADAIPSDPLIDECDVLLAGP